LGTSKEGRSPIEERKYGRVALLKRFEMNEMGKYDKMRWELSTTPANLLKGLN